MERSQSLVAEAYKMEEAAAVGRGRERFRPEALQKLLVIQPWKQERRRAKRGWGFVPGTTDDTWPILNGYGISPDTSDVSARRRADRERRRTTDVCPEFWSCTCCEQYLCVDSSRLC